MFKCKERKDTRNNPNIAFSIEHSALSCDLCLRVARAPADSGCLGPGPGLYPMSGRSLDHSPGRTISQAGTQP